MMLTMFAAGTMITGCGDDIKTVKKVELKDVPVGEPKAVID